MQDVDFSANLVIVRSGKGDKDRVTMLPAAVKPDLGRWLEFVRGQHQQKPLGHRDVTTTMIYTHVLNRGPAAVQSPADRMFNR